MRINTKDIPQADDLNVVLQAVDCVARGGTSFQDIAASLGYNDRQGRYYRRAAEVLGFLTPSRKNQSTLKPAGEAILTATGASKTAQLGAAILRLPLFQRLIPFIESAGTIGRTRDELAEFLRDVTQTTPGMVSRRLSTLISWMRSSELIFQRGDNYVFNNLPSGVDMIEYTSSTEPLFPSRFNLAEYDDIENRSLKNKADLIYEVDSVKRDRANSAHIKLVNLVAQRLRSRGIVPRSNSYIDLAAEVAEKPFIFEIKSISNTNCITQLRRGLSQLYEYRYRQILPNAQLVLVIEKPLPDISAWAVEYLITDRNIGLIWDGSGLLNCDARQAKLLSFLF